jgi:ubiquinone/menaquinone biosynthesis C-methylase UbiE
MDYDAELQSHNEPLLAACAIRLNQHVLDIGCGTGHTTREAARRAAMGNALGIDIVERSIERARALAAVEGIHNLGFEQGDAQTHPLPPQRFDLAMSRYGTMFFADPIAAFRNLRTALVPGGRLIMMVWQAHELNEWSVAVHQALEPHFSLDPSDQQHFSLSDPITVRLHLETAGFHEITFEDVREPVYYGSDIEAAMEWVGGFQFVAETVQGIDVAAGKAVLQRLRETLSRRSTDKGVWFGAREWIVSAVNR